MALSAPTDDEPDHLQELLRRGAERDRWLSLEAAQRAADETGFPFGEVELCALRMGLVPRRYERNLGTVRPEGQLRLAESRAAVVGLGGLGGHVAESLARLGVGHIIGVDPDRFAETNLNRQSLATVEGLGAEKTERAAHRLAQVNPAVEFTGHAVPVGELEEDALAGCVVAFDCLDCASVRRELARKCARAEVPLVHGAIAGWSGQVALFMPGADLLAKLYGTAEHGIERRLGNPAFTAAVAANLMVARAMPLLLGRQVEGAEEVLFFDLLDGEWEKVDLGRRG